MMRTEGAASSHVGQIRKVNQDRAIFSTSLGAVADGMGGHLGGEQAASIVIAELGDVTGSLTQEDLVEVVRDANRKVFAESNRPELKGMGTTVVAVTLHPDTNMVSVVNVGDSRAYRLRGDVFEQLTEDHSLVEELVRQGRLSPDEARSHPQRNIVTRVVGLATTVDVDIFEFDAQHGDRFLLCSDGLFNEVPAKTIAGILGEFAEPADTADRLVKLAVEEGGRDNVSAVVVDVVDDEAPAPEPIVDVTIMEPDFVEPHPTQRFDPIGVTSQVQRRSVKRFLGFGSAVLIVGALAFLSISWFGSNAYFAADEDGEVVILRGRPGGLLWIDPEVVDTTGIATEDLNEASLQRLSQKVQWSSRDDVQLFVENLELADTAAG